MVDGQLSVVVRSPSASSMVQNGLFPNHPRQCDTRNGEMEMFCHILFGRQMSLKRLFGRDIFSRFAMCLFGASLVLCFERHSGRESV